MLDVGDIQPTGCHVGGNQKAVRVSREPDVERSVSRREVINTTDHRGLSSSGCHTCQIRTAVFLLSSFSDPHAFLVARDPNPVKNLKVEPGPGFLSSS
jgi:hypothetical protein